MASNRESRSTSSIQSRRQSPCHRRIQITMTQPRVPPSVDVAHQNTTSSLVKPAAAPPELAHVRATRNTPFTQVAVLANVKPPRECKRTSARWEFGPVSQRNACRKSCFDARTIALTQSMRHAHRTLHSPCNKDGWGWGWGRTCAISQHVWNGLSSAADSGGCNMLTPPH